MKTLSFLSYIMELEDKPKPDSTLPVLPRLDRIDHLVQLLEDHKSSLSGRQSLNPENGIAVEEEDQRKTLSRALNEVHHKGTLMERLEMLEKRVIELSLDMVEEKYSRSSSSNLPISEKSNLSSLTKEDEDVTKAAKEKSDPLKIQEETNAISPILHDKKGKQKRKAHRRWRSFFAVCPPHK